MSQFDEVLDIRDMEELTANVREFQATRDWVLGRRHHLPQSIKERHFEMDDGSVMDLGIGTPPFLIWNGTDTYYAVILENGDVRPLPYAYELDPNDLNPQQTINYVTLSMLSYVSLRKDFELPDDDEFELERVCDEWEASKYELDGLDYDDGRWIDAETRQPYTGEATATWPNGKLRKKAHLTDGTLNGKLTWWYENGQKELEDHYVAGARHGRHLTWHENGRPWAKGEYTHGEKQGQFRWWHDNGQLAEETSYVDDEPHGKHQKWHANGNQSLLTTFVDGIEQGLHKEWHENGQLYSELTVEDGEVHGTVRFWDEDGNLTAERQFEYGEALEEDIDELYEDVQDLKEQLLDSISSDELRAELGELLSVAEAEAGGDQAALGELLRDLIDQGQEYREAKEAEAEAKQPLIQATVDGDREEVRRLLADGAETNFGTPGFVYAILTDQKEIFEIYVEHGIDVGAKFNWHNEDGSVLEDTTALALAAAAGSAWGLERLIDLGAADKLDIDDLARALTATIANEHSEGVRYLLDNLGDLAHEAYGRALVQASHMGEAELVTELLDRGAPVNATGRDGWSALKSAVRGEYRELIQVLIASGADCDIPDREGWTALLNAIENRDLESVDLLLSNGADPNAAPECDDEDDQNGFSALMRAAQFGESEILKSLIGAGADLNQTDADGYTALHNAALFRHALCVEYLLIHGAEPNRPANNGFTPAANYLLGLAEGLRDEGTFDEREAIDTLKALVGGGADWLDAKHMIFKEGPLNVTLMDIALAIVAKEGFEDLKETFSEISLQAQLTDSSPWRSAARTGDIETIRDLIRHEVSQNDNDDLNRALLVAVACLVGFEEKFVFLNANMEGFGERFAAPKDYATALMAVCERLLDAGARLNANSPTQAKILALLEENEETAAIAERAVDSAEQNRAAAKPDSPVAGVLNAAEVAISQYESILDVSSRRDFHLQAIDTLEKSLAAAESYDSLTLSERNEFGRIRTTLAEIYCDEWDLDNALRHVVALESTGYCLEASANAIPYDFRLRLVEMLSTLAKRLGAAGRSEDAISALTYAEKIYDATDLNFASDVADEKFKGPRPIISGEKKLRIVLKHPRQADNALALGLISAKKHAQLKQKFAND